MVAIYGQPTLTDSNTNKLHGDFMPAGVAYYTQLERVYANSGVSGVTGTSNVNGFTYVASQAGAKLIITKVIVRCYAASSTVPGTLSVGDGVASDNIVSATAATDVNAVGDYIVLTPKSGAIQMDDGDTIKYAWAGWTGTTTLTFYPFGYELIL